VPKSKYASSENGCKPKIEFSENFLDGNFQGSTNEKVKGLFFGEGLAVCEEMDAKGQKQPALGRAAETLAILHSAVWEDVPNVKELRQLNNKLHWAVQEVLRSVLASRGTLFSAGHAALALQLAPLFLSELDKVNGRQDGVKVCRENTLRHVADVISLIPE
jgi:hypothetical protein